MKRYYWLLAVLATIAAGALGVPLSASAQQAGVAPLWANYLVEARQSGAENDYQPLPGTPTDIPPDNFLNVVGLPDHDDGIADNIGTGFSFDYNGNTYNSVNVAINGFVTLGALHTSPHELGGGGGNWPFAIGNSALFGTMEPNNVLAPYWGDHVMRTATEVIANPQITKSVIHYTKTGTAPNRLFMLEWQNLNINITDKINPNYNSIASFQLFIRENPLANDPAIPDHRATFEFKYGPVGANGTVNLIGAAVGANDSVGNTHLNALYATATKTGDAYGGQQLDSARLNTVTRTSCWPPVAGMVSVGVSGQSCIPGMTIWLVPQGRGSYAQWGDGDVNLDQVYNLNAKIRANQNLFVNFTDADLILQSIVNNVPLDSVEGRAAFHGDANHSGRVFNANYGAYFYHANEYDASYILMYLAGKLATLPWPYPLPVPSYKESDIHTTDVSAIVADASNARVIGSTVLVPLTMRGRANGALGVSLNVAGMNSANLQLVGTRAIDGGLVRANAASGKFALALSGNLEDGATVGYLEFNVTNARSAEFDLTDVNVNDETRAGSHVALKLSGAGASGAANALVQNAPNPFMLASATHTTIGFDLANSVNVSLRVYDMLGHEVRSLVTDENRAAGHNSVEWDGRDANGNTVSSGLYYYQIVTPDFTQTVKMQVVR